MEHVSSRLRGRLALVVVATTVVAVTSSLLAGCAAVAPSATFSLENATANPTRAEVPETETSGPAPAEEAASEGATGGGPSDDAVDTDSGDNDATHRDGEEPAKEEKERPPRHPDEEKYEEAMAMTAPGYSGVLRWHTIAYDEVNTEKANDSTFRGAPVTAAHCYFSRWPNKDTPIFALLVKHTRHRGDTFYLGRDGMAISRLNTVPLADARRAPVRLEPSQMYCVFRPDQNEVGAVIFQYRGADDAEGGGENARYALVWVEAPNMREPSKKFIMSVDPQTGERVKMPLERYVAPDSRVVGSFDSLADALVAAEEVIPRGRFRLRRENAYPYMRWQSYLTEGLEEFCPVRVECRNDPAIDIVLESETNDAR